MCAILERVALGCGHTWAALKFPSKVRTIFLLLLLAVVGPSDLPLSFSSTTD